MACLTLYSPPLVDIVRAEHNTVVETRSTNLKSSPRMVGVEVVIEARSDPPAIK